LRDINAKPNLLKAPKAGSIAQFAGVNQPDGCHFAVFFQTELQKQLKKPFNPLGDNWNSNKGSIINADGMLYYYDKNTVDVALVRPSPKGFDIVSSFRVT
jgi:hypothetical protein